MFSYVSKEDCISDRYYFGHKIISPTLLKKINKNSCFYMSYVALDINSLENCYLDSPRTFINDPTDPECSITMYIYNRFGYDLSIHCFFNFCIYK